MEPNLPLRDIHLPDPIGWWPLAPGWWLLLIGIPTLLIFSIGLWRFIRRKTVKKLALAELESIVQSQTDAREKVQQLAILMRRISLSVYQREEVASLVGEQWLSFLDGLMGDKQFSEGAGRLFIEAPYRREAQADMDALFSLCRQFIKSLPRAGKSWTKPTRKQANQSSTAEAEVGKDKLENRLTESPEIQQASTKDYSRFARPSPSEEKQP